MADRSTSSPAVRLLLGESRVLFELGAFAAASPFLRLLGRGDQHPVLVLPGFTASDRSTQPLRWFLRGQGYWVHGWRLGPNLGPTLKIMTGLGERLATVHERHGRKVTVVGWSLGGIYARFLARSNPDAVRQVITLGSPFRMRPGDRSNASALFESLAGRHVDFPKEAFIAEQDMPPLPVPSTAVYTRTDGIVRWHMCIDAEGPNRENIEVTGSHSGLGYNPAVLLAIADRLSQPEGDWRAFHAPLWARRFFPRPVAWEERVFQNQGSAARRPA